MFPAFLILIVLALVSPITPFLDGNIVLGIEATAMAVATALVARKSLSEEIAPVLRLFRLVSFAGRKASDRDYRPTSRSLVSRAATKDDSLNSTRLPQIFVTARTIEHILQDDATGCLMWQLRC